MASNQTANYGLSQWEAEDKVLRTDFNADNAKIDAALKGKSQIEAGTYTGTGTYGENAPNILTFSFEPRVVLLMGFNHSNTASQMPGVTVMINGFGQAAVLFGNRSYSPECSSGRLFASFNGQSVSYYSDSVYSQLNYSGNTYHYIAIG